MNYNYKPATVGVEFFFSRSQVLSVAILIVIRWEVFLKLNANGAASPSPPTHFDVGNIFIFI